MYVEVLLPLNLDRLFTYEVSAADEDKIKPFVRVLVEFGKSKLYSALVINVKDDIDGDYNIKKIISVLDKKPVINEKTFSLWKWIARYYLSSLGDVMNVALPSALKLESTLIVYPVKNHCGKLAKTESKVLEYLEGLEYATLSEIEKDLGIKTAKKHITKLFEKGCVKIEQKIRDKAKAHTVKVIKPGKKLTQTSFQEIIGELKKSRAQEAILLEFASKSGLLSGKQNMTVLKSELFYISKSPSAFKALKDKGILVEEAVLESELTGQIATVPPVPLSPVQKKSLAEIRKSFEKHETVLFHGVTSSGKTEIYIHLIQEQIKRGNQVLYLLPEIALTAQIINRLKKHFGNAVGVYHSKFSDAERYAVWTDLKDKGNLKVILGVRAALFLPFSDLGLIIVDEEHESTYKQFEPVPRYNARDAAIVLAGLHGGKVLLGTATPSVESYYNATVAGKYGYVRLEKRFGNIKLPEIVTVDMKAEIKEKKNHFSFSSVLKNAIEASLKNSEQVILFQNRRGYSPYSVCSKCGYIEKCPHCDVSLTYHRSSDKLVCHYCEYTTKFNSVCPECGSEMKLNSGIGTEKIEEECKTLFPDARIARMDLDSMRRKHAHEKLINAFEKGEIDILIGTQMVTKGLDFENVSVVGVLDVDAMLNFPDFRAYERTFNLITQVSGRAGRKNKQGLVILQTHNPDHEIIRQIKSYDFESFYKSQLQERLDFNYPPFSHLIKIIFRHTDGSRAEYAAEQMAKNLKRYFGSNRVLGPSRPIVPRIRNKHYFEVIIKVEKNILKAIDFLRQKIAEYSEEWSKKGVDIIADTDTY